VNTPAAEQPPVIVVRWGPVQGRALNDDTTRYLDLEGAIRSGKTTLALHKVAKWVTDNPGAHVLITRWQETDFNAQIKPRWREIATQVGLSLKWHADEQYDELPNGSRVYLRHLKAGEQTSRYSKFRGLTLSMIYLDQAEEAPEDVFLELKGRLSQPGFPQQMLLTPNPPGLTHWLALQFPEDNSRPDHRYIRITVDDNVMHIGQAYCDNLKRDYAAVPSLYRRLIEGRRGLAIVGEPVYKGSFSRARNVREGLRPISGLSIYEGWDFGHKHPAVSWWQYVRGEAVWLCLGEKMGHNVFLEDFAPEVLVERAQRFPGTWDFQSCADPSGFAENNHGARIRAVDILSQNGINPMPSSNHLLARDAAIQLAAGFMGRGKVLIDDSCTILIDGFEAGYVWDDEKGRSATLSHPNVRRPMKDGYYDHLQNTWEYIQITFGAAHPTLRQQHAEEARSLKQQQRDRDSMDQRPSSRFSTRGGY
jgi:hypothetical protein